jgi:hypothetical protein
VEVKTALYQRSSAFSRLLRRQLRAVLLPRFAPEHREAYASQFDEASRNVEIAVEGLLRLGRRDLRKLYYVVEAIVDWRRRYHGTASATRNLDRTLVYTHHDHQIPFRPEADTLYAYMVGQIADIANELAAIVSADQMRSISDGVMEMNTVGCEAFAARPTFTPRFLDHDRLTLGVVQAIDDPINCCPSLHIAYSLYFDNLAEFLVKPFRRKREVFEAIRFCTIGMFNSVLYTKQHSILDVAFGVLCARIVFERRFDQPFNDFTAVFDELARSNPIPYGVIREMLDEATQLYHNEGTLARALAAYLDRHQHPTISAAERRIVFFQSDEKRICYAEELSG